MFLVRTGLKRKHVRAETNPDAPKTIFTSRNNSEWDITIPVFMWQCPSLLSQSLDTMVWIPPRVRLNFLQPSATHFFFPAEYRSRLEIIKSIGEILIERWNDWMRFVFSSSLCEIPLYLPDALWLVQIVWIWGQPLVLRRKTDFNTPVV